MTKPKTIRQLKKELWKWFSLFIRQRDGYKCVTCGKYAEGSGMHAGHYITKAAGGLALYFHENNVHAQCFRCNIHLSGNWSKYRDFILEKYGEAVDKELMRLRYVVLKWTTKDYEEKINHYKSLVK